MNTNPAWTPDGSSIAFNSTREPPGIYVQPPEVNGAARLVLRRDPDGGSQVPASWSPDGRVLFFSARSFETASDLWTVDANGHAEKLLATPAEERSPIVSPDGRWLAYQSDASEQPEVYVRPYPGPGRTEIVSDGGGIEPRWAGSRELIYRRDRAVVAVPMASDGESLTIGRATVLFEIDDYPTHYDVTPDGRQFLLLRRDATASSTPSHVNVVDPGSRSSSASCRSIDAARTRHALGAVRDAANASVVSRGGRVSGVDQWPDLGVYRGRRRE